MTPEREEWLDRMITLFGYEHPITINYAHELETLPPEYDKFLETKVQFHETYFV